MPAEGVYAIVDDIIRPFVSFRRRVFIMSAVYCRLRAPVQQHPSLIDSDRFPDHIIRQWRLFTTAAFICTLSEFKTLCAEEADDM